MFSEQERLGMLCITASRDLGKPRTNVSNSNICSSWKSNYTANHSYLVKQQTHHKTHCNTNPSEGCKKIYVF